MGFRNPFKGNTHTRGDYCVLIDIKTGKSIRLDSTTIANLEINYMHQFRIFAELSINDMYDLLNKQDLNSNIQVEIYQFDALENKTKRCFQVISVEKKRINTRTQIDFKLQDFISYALDNIFAAKTYSNVKLSDIFKDLIGSISPSIKTKFECDDTEVVREYAALTANKSALDFMLEETYKEGFYLFQDKETIYLKKYNNLLKFDKNEYIYTDRAKDQRYHYSIYEYNKVDLPANKLEDSNISLSYDPANKTMQIYEKNLKDINLKQDAENRQRTVAVKYKSQEILTESGVALKTVMSFLKENCIYAIIPGELKSTGLFRKFEVKITGNAYVQQETLGTDDKLSGDYVCLGYIDKLLFNTYFISYVLLGKL